jgi:hypothetical protein
MFGLSGQHSRLSDAICLEHLQPNNRVCHEYKEIIMDNKELFIKLGELQGLKIDQDRAELMTNPNGSWDMIQLIRSILFKVDVIGARPQDDLRFDIKEVLS